MTGTKIPNEQSVIAIGIAGGSGSGKTTLSRRIYEELGSDKNVTYLLHDNYYKDISHLSLKERSLNNFDHPSSLDTNLLVEHIRALKSKKSVKVPNYDFTTHMRTKEVTQMRPKPIILVEGILLFTDPILLKELNIKVFVVSSKKLDTYY